MLRIRHGKMKRLYIPSVVCGSQVRGFVKKNPFQVYDISFKRTNMLDMLDAVVKLFQTY